MQTTFGSTLALGTLAMTQTIIGICLGPFAGVVADRFNRKWLIVGADIVRGLIYCSLAWLVFTGRLTLPILYITIGLAAICSQFFYPAISSSIPLFPDKELERANSLNQMSVSLVNIVGYAAGGIMVALIGIPALLLINGLSFLASALSETFISIPLVTGTHVKAGARAFLGDIITGFNYIRSNAALFKILQVAMVVNFFFAPYVILLPKFVNDFMGAGSDVYGFLLSAHMAGALLATLVISLTKFVQQNLWLVKWSMVVQASLMGTLPFLPIHLWQLRIGVFAFAGLFNATLNIYFGAIVQRATEQKHIGKVFGVLGTMTQALQPASQGLSGVLGEVIRLPVIYTVCSIANGLGGFMFAAIPGLNRFISAKPGEDKEIQPAPAQV